jgi:DNA-directed RNA polymerase specialized sigma24 family protein
MGVFRVESNYFAEVTNSFLVHINMLVCFSPLMKIQNISGGFFNTLRKRVDRFLKFLKSCISKPDVVEDIVFELWLRSTAQRAFKECCNFSKFLIRIVIDA